MYLLSHRLVPIIFLIIVYFGSMACSNQRKHKENTRTVKETPLRQTASDYTIVAYQIYSRLACNGCAIDKEGPAWQAKFKQWMV
ncbi:hypothetical protein CF651_07510 [Paenibacillus rigui]|uniref:Uncharacterized protein n=1 Tax=Paenibacillus rigui TaxID=554312 RepID=A0A229UUC7_9BACL|nr:hypothetical protein CF651_07510 [Paenibacillus rigui]